MHLLSNYESNYDKTFLPYCYDHSCFAKDGLEWIDDKWAFALNDTHLLRTFQSRIPSKTEEIKKYLKL